MDESNPFSQPHTKIDSVAAGPANRYGRSRFSYVVATILGASFLLTLIVAPKFAMSSEAALIFFGAVAIGPFSITLHQSWIYSSPELAIGIAIFLTTILHLVIPRKATFVVSIFGAIAWAFFGAYLILLFA